jgi:hypothetical protein
MLALTVATPDTRADPVNALSLASAPLNGEPSDAKESNFTIRLQPFSAHVIDRGSIAAPGPVFNDSPQEQTELPF